MCVTQLCSAFKSRADCAPNESCASLVGRGGERERQKRRKRESEGGEGERTELKGSMKAEREGRIIGGAGGLEKCMCWGFFFLPPQSGAMRRRC